MPVRNIVDTKTLWQTKIGKVRYAMRTLRGKKSKMKKQQLEDIEQCQSAWNVFSFEEQVDIH